MWNGTEWIEVPSTVTGTASSGSVTTNSAVSDFSNRYFALGYKASVPKTYVPDDNFENYLESVGWGDGIALNDSVITSSISQVVTLDINALSISDLTGIESFNALKNLYCQNNIKLSNLHQINI